MLGLAVGVAQQASVPMDEEPHHHVLLKNEFVEVIRATIPPGDSTLFHTHVHDSVGFDLAKSTSTEQFLGKPEGPPIDVAGWRGLGVDAHG